MNNNKSYYKWLAWGLPVLAYVICFFHSLSMGVIRESLIGEFGISEIEFSNISTAYFYIYLLMQIPSGILVDTIGPRKTVAAGTMLSAVGSLIFATATGVFSLVLGRLIIGLGVSVIFISIIKIQSLWFKPSEFGTMSGLTCFIGTMGGVLAQTPLAVLIEGLSWRGAFKLIVVLSVAIAVLVYLFVKDSPEKSVSDTKETLSVSPQKKHQENTQVPRKRIGNFNIWEAMKSIFANKRTWPPFLLYATFYGTFVMISGFWGTAFMSGVYHISIIEGSKYISMVVLGSAFGAIIIGWLSDKIQKRRLPIVLYSLGYIAMWGAIVFINGGKPPLVVMMPLLFSLGFFSQGFVLSWAIGKDVNKPEYVGMASSIINVGGFLGSIVVPTIIATGLNFYKDAGSLQLMYQKTFFIVFVLAIITLGFSLMVKETNHTVFK